MLSLTFLCFIFVLLICLPYFTPSSFPFLSFGTFWYLSSLSHFIQRQGGKKRLKILMWFSYLADPRTLEAICQLQLVSCVQSAVITEWLSNLLVSLCVFTRDWHDLTAKKCHCHQSSQRGSLQKLKHDLTRVNAAITRQRTAISTPALVAFQSFKRIL